MAKISQEYAEARAASVVARMPAIQVELPYAWGRIKWDNRFPKPPAWTIKAIRQLGNRRAPFAFLQQINKPGEQWSTEDVGRAVGFIQSGSLLLSGGAEAFEELRRTLPLFGAYFDQVAQSLAVPQKRKRPAKSDRLPQIKTTSQLAAFRRGLSKSSNDLFEDDGTPLQNALAHEILIRLWYFWPEVAKFKSTRQLHSWLREDGDIHCSEKLVEKVCRSIGLRFRARGRPKNPTLRKR